MPPGVVNGGINVPDVAPTNVYTTLDVNTVTGNLISPDANVDGINFTNTSNHNITIYSVVNITTSGTGDGIRANTNGYTGNILIDSTGNVTSGGSYGIRARYGSGDVSITNHGNITAQNSGIYAYASGTVTVDSTGDVSSTSGTGIRVSSYGTGDVTLDSVGAVSGSDGILVQVHDGSFTITSTGDVTATRPLATPSTDVRRKPARSRLTAATVYGEEQRRPDQNNTTLYNSASLSGGMRAVFSAGTNNIINNDGTITGNVDVGGSGTTKSSTTTWGDIHAGATVNLGANTRYSPTPATCRRAAPAPCRRRR